MNDSMSIHSDDEPLTPKQAAQLLKVSVGTLAVWRSTKRYDLKVDPAWQKNGEVQTF